MTEELEREAEQFAEKHAFRVPYDGSNKFYDDTDYKASKDGYLAGAEPREQKIKDLEEQLQEVAKDNDNYQKENKKLEEENERLKKDLNIALNKFADGYQGSLTIAKEIIRELIDNFSTFCEDCNDSLLKADTFLTDCSTKELGIAPDVKERL